MVDAALLEPAPKLSAHGIPIRNIWLLLLYASEFFKGSGHAFGSFEQAPHNTADLIAEFLAFAVEKRLRQDLTRQYRQQSEALTRVRGRVDLLGTERKGLLAQGKVLCLFEELTVNSPRNCFIRGALEHLGKLASKESLRNRCIQLGKRLQMVGVRGKIPTLREVHSEQFGRHDKKDKQMVAAAKLAFQLKVPIEGGGSESLVDIVKNEIWFRQLFEKAVAGFYEVVLSQQDWWVEAAKRQYWPVTGASEGMLSILPGMQTDIILNHRASNRRIVIDTKFANIFTRNQHGTEQLKTGYLYQLYAYLRTQEREDDPLSLLAEGLLLHPAIDRNIKEYAHMQGHTVRVATVDLAANSDNIRRELLSIIIGED